MTQIWTGLRRSAGAGDRAVNHLQAEAVVMVFRGLAAAMVDTHANGHSREWSLQSLLPSGIFAR